MQWKDRWICIDRIDRYRRNHGYNNSDECVIIGSSFDEIKAYNDAVIPMAVMVDDWTTLQTTMFCQFSQFGVSKWRSVDESHDIY